MYNNNISKNYFGCL